MRIHAILSLLLLVSPLFGAAQTWDVCKDWDGARLAFDQTLCIGWAKQSGDTAKGVLMWMPQEKNGAEALQNAVLMVGPRFEPVQFVIGETVLPVLPAGLNPVQMPLYPYWNGQKAQVKATGLSKMKGAMPVATVRRLVVDSVVKDAQHAQVIYRNVGTSKIKKQQANWNVDHCTHRDTVLLSAKPGETVSLSVELCSTEPFHPGRESLRFRTEVRMPSWADSQALSFCANLPAEVQWADGLLVNGERMRIQGLAIDMAYWKSSTNWKLDGLKAFVLAGGNSILWLDGPAPLPLLEMCMSNSLMLFETADSRGMYLDSYPCLMGKWTPGRGIVCYGSDLELSESPGEGPWINSGLAVTPGMGDWLARWNASASVDGFVGGFIPANDAFRAELLLSDGRPTPAMLEIREAFASDAVTVGRDERGVYVLAPTQEDAREFWSTKITVFGSDGQKLSATELAPITSWNGDRAELGHGQEALRVFDACKDQSAVLDVQVLEVPRAGSHRVRTVAQWQLFQPQSNGAESTPNEMPWELMEGDTYALEADSITYVVSARTGLLQAAFTPTVNLLPLPAQWTFDRLEVPGDAHPHPMQDSRLWRDAGNRATVLFAEVEGARLSMSGELMGDQGSFQTVYEVDERGVLHVSGYVQFTPGVTPPLRVGHVFINDTTLSETTWFGKGQQENYVDRNAGAFWGNYRTRGEYLAQPYRSVRETGSISEALSVTLNYDSGWGLNWSSSTPFGFSAVPYVERMQTSGSEWNRTRDLPVFTLNAYQAPLNPQVWDPASARDISWNWSLSPVPPTR